MTSTFRLFRGRMAAGLLALAALAGALLPGAAAAQTTTGQIRGQVVDENGEPLPAVLVTGTNTQTGLVRQARTGEDGVYTLRLLTPGDYRVRGELVGRAPGELAGIRVALNETSTANLRLTPQAVVLEALVVSGEQPIVSTTDGGVRQLVDREQIETLPALGRDFTDFINLSGQVSPVPEETTGGQFSIGGLRPSQTTVLIDGVDANNSFFGENRGGSRIPFNFSLESISQFQIITNAYDVEFGSYAGGVVNVITRGGTNEFDGSAYVNFRDAALTADNFEPTILNGDSIWRPEDYSVVQYAARVAGPIIRDRLFFNVSVDGQRRREPQTPLTAGSFLTGENPDQASYDSIQKYFDILENQYGVADAESLYQPFNTTNDVLTLFGRLDWAVNDNHKLTLRHNYSNYRNLDEFSPIFDVLYGRSRAEDYRDTNHSFVTELQSVLGSRTFNVLRFQYASEDRPREGNDLRPEVRVNLGTGEQVRYGGSFAAFRNDLEERKLQFIDNLTHSLGNHTLKVGFNGLFTNVRNQFLLEGAGRYDFRSLADFAAYRPASFTRNVRGNGEVPYAEFDVMEWGLYLQDEWTATPRLTVTAGVRYDRQSFLDEPGRVVDAERAFGLETGVSPTDDDNISPRLSVAYDITGNGTSVVRAGAGYFYSSVPYVLGGNVQQTELPILSLRCFGQAGDPDAPPALTEYGQWSPTGVDNPFTCGGQGGVGGVPTYTFWMDDFEFPETFKANVGYETLLTPVTRLSADVIYSTSRQLYTVSNINLRDPVFSLTGEGGRLVFRPEAQFDPTGTGGSAHLRNLDFADVLANRAEGRSRSLSATVRMERSLGERSYVGASYTYTTAQDNSSYSCCTAFGGWSDVSVGAYGPNQVGLAGDQSRAWGASDFVRNHVIVVDGAVRLPYGFRASGVFRAQSGRPWSAQANNADLNGDGLDNDRLFIFSPENLPLASTGDQAAAERAMYAGYLAEYDCIGDYVGQIVPRNTCRQPWYNTFDVQIARSFGTVAGQRAELQLDLFNVLNGLNSDWGRYVGVFGNSRMPIQPVGYDAATDRILYRVRDDFYETGTIGSNLVLQFQAQIGLKYYF